MTARMRQIANYWDASCGRHDRVGPHAFVIEQGDAIGRPSRITVSLTIADGRLVQARIGGEAVIVSEGQLRVLRNYYSPSRGADTTVADPSGAGTRAARPVRSSPALAGMKHAIGAAARVIRPTTTKAALKSEFCGV